MSFIACAEQLSKSFPVSALSLLGKSCLAVYLELRPRRCLKHFCLHRYGDKIPKSSLGRLFGVIWILVGAVMLSMFTAMATNAMNTALDGTICKDIDDKEVSGTKS